MEARDCRTGLSLFDYTDYRLYLKDYYSSRKKNQPGWGLAAWSAQLGLKSKSSLAMILNGQRHPSRELTSSFVGYFEFQARETEYFSDLVEWQKAARSSRLSALLSERLAKKRKAGRFDFLDYQRFQVMSDWYFAVLREIFQLRGFKLDIDWISHLLEGQISAREVKQALAMMVRLGLVRQGARGLELTGEHLVTDSDVSNQAVKRFHQQMLDRANLSLRKTPIAEREIQTTTLAVREKDVPRAKELLRVFTNEFADNIESKNGDRVYALQINFFPLTRKRGDL